MFLYVTVGGIKPLIYFHFIQPSSIEKKQDGNGLTVKFMHREEENRNQQADEISGADCVIFAIGRNPKVQNLGLEKLVKVLFHFDLIMI